MTISLSNTGKRFNREWIFRHFTYQFHAGNAYAITGANGSGKSTLLQVLSGSMLFNEGTCSWHSSRAPIKDEEVFRHVSICAPYLELVEEMTLTELLHFHQQFKPLLAGFTIPDIIARIGLDSAANKQIRYYSSGMKQRVKLAQCLFSNTSIVLLDEPCTNLDKTGINLYLQLVQQLCANRLVVVSSNDKTEYQFCQEIIQISDYKK